MTPWGDSTLFRRTGETMSEQRDEPFNAFSDEYLSAVQERDEPSTAHEAETSGPFSLAEQEGLLALYRPWESAESGDVPLALFLHRETALLFQAIWPAIGRSRLYRLREAPNVQGYGLEEGGQVVGSLRSFDPDAVLGGHFASYLARAPLSLALLVEAAGPAAQKLLGRILAARLQAGS
jgi:hypothetical protein